MLSRPGLNPASAVSRATLRYEEVAVTLVTPVTLRHSDKKGGPRWALGTALGTPWVLDGEAAILQQWVMNGSYRTVASTLF